MSKGISLHLGLNYVDPAHYGGWDGELRACENDAHDMEALAASQGFSASKLLRESATRDAVIGKIEEAAAGTESGDIFLLTYSGHGGQVPNLGDDEEYDAQDETWCLFDGQLIDDELRGLWGRFPAGSRVLVFSDSCHSGTVIRAMANQGVSYSDLPKRSMPDDVALRTWRQNRSFYEKLDVSAGQDEIAARVRLISGCQDNQSSYDGTFNGQFTGALLRVWGDGDFRGDYARFHSQILNLLPAYQSPNHFVIGASDPDFDAEKPFTI